MSLKGVPNLFAQKLGGSHFMQVRLEMSVMYGLDHSARLERSFISTTYSQ